MDVLGIDFGNVNTKNSKGKIFKSCIKTGADLKFKADNDPNLMVINGQKILVGEGEYQTDTDKFDKNMLKYCVLKSIALATDSMDVKVMMGLPAVQYSKASVEKARQILLSEKMYNFTLGGKKRTVIIEDIDFFPESAGAYYSLSLEQRVAIRGRDALLVNIGGGNTNIGYFKLAGETSRVLEKNSTIMSGIFNLYGDVIDFINGKYLLNKGIEDAERFIKNKEIFIYGQSVKLPEIEDIMKTHLDKIFKELNLYSLKDSAVIFTGGGAEVYRELLKERVRNCLFQEDGVFGNAKGFAKVGELKWQKGFL